MENVKLHKIHKTFRIQYKTLQTNMHENSIMSHNLLVRTSSYSSISNTKRGHM